MRHQETRNYRMVKRYFNILNCLGMDHMYDRQTNGQTDGRTTE